MEYPKDRQSLDNLISKTNNTEILIEQSMDVIDINNDSLLVNSVEDSLAQTADIKNNMHINGSVNDKQQTRITQGATGT